MKDISEYGTFQEEEWGLPWIDYDNRPLFKIWASPEEIAPFFFVEHHPVSLSLLLYISEHYKKDVFLKAGLNGSSQDWKNLAKRLIQDYEEDNSGIDMFQFDCDDDVFCIYSEYVDDLIAFTKRYLKAICNDEEKMLSYLLYDI